MKKPPRSYTWQQQLEFSNGFAPTADEVFPFLRGRIPNFLRVRKAPNQNDRTGIDYLIDRQGLPMLGVDAKIRDTDWSVRPPQFADDLALETYSKVEEKKIGWTRDSSKAADYILWFWKDTGRFFIKPFPPLCAIFQRHWEDWRKQFGPPSLQHTPGFRGGWHSECIFVPRQIVIDHMLAWMGVRPTSTAKVS